MTTTGMTTREGNSSFTTRSGGGSSIVGEDIKVMCIEASSPSSSSPSSSSSSKGTTHDWWIDQILDLQSRNHKHTLNHEEQDSGFVTICHAKSDLEEMVQFCPQFVAVVDVDDEVDDDDDDDMNGDANGDDSKEEQQYPKIVGYTLTVDKQAISASPSLAKLYKLFFDMADAADWNPDMNDDDNEKDPESSSSSSEPPSSTASSSPSPSSLATLKWALGAQVCVDKNHRRKGILQRLYDAQAERLFAPPTSDTIGVDATAASAGSASSSSLSSSSFEAIVTAVDHANLPSLRAHEKAKFQVVTKFPAGGRDDTGWSLIARTVPPA
eukprot:CAMPEP_0117077506 /NCGR_PEP_ID=MMETSP0472-20121206/54656_1 /TAXON_ID=693140 ORGANISM="Tiarina fusus, Strain LIS" /NCGR_SAMPLE_ID=MMETSP0472 /ASSEMBLY_ACC=CAM_ASM_000603 /LENGTH=324 /DNA_ID=CAMNT_0004803883 /DNA_START=230 /DNA_END=1204 /DNA_ORIENTATION=-